LVGWLRVGKNACRFPEGVIILRLGGAQLKQKAARQSGCEFAAGRKAPPKKSSRKRRPHSPFAKLFWDVTRSHVMADLMKAPELKERLKKIPEWELEKKHIERTFEFDDFADAIDFVNSVSEVAEEEEHHPDIDIRYNKVRLVLSTHSKGGLTELDFGLAERIDTLAE
jgi:4a-hydroxytetrahydrobiopterin dehydratase